MFNEESKLYMISEEVGRWNYEYWAYFMNNDKENIAYQGYLTLTIFRTEKICNQFYNDFRTVCRMNQSSSLTSLQIDSINISVYVPKVTTLEIREGRCCGLKVCISPKFICWSFNPWGHGIGKCSLRKTNRFRCGHKLGPRDGIRALVSRDQWACSFFLGHVSSRTATCDHGIFRHQACCRLDLSALSLRTVRNVFIV